MVVFRSMSFDITPPLVSMPKERGVTSRSSTSLTSPAKTPLWMAAPVATTSSGLMPLFGSLPVISLTCSRVLHRLPDRTGRRLHKVGGELVELRTAKREIKVLGAGLISGDKGLVDARARRGGELLFGLLRRLKEALGSHLVLREIYPFGLRELLYHPFDDLSVEVNAAEVVVPARGLDLKDALTEREDRDVKRPTAEVEDEDGLLPFLVEPIGECRGGRLVDDTLDVEARDAAGVLGRLPLGVLEVRGHRDDRLGNHFAEVLLGVPLKLLQDHRGDLRWRVLLVVDAHPHVSIRAALDLITHTPGFALDIAEAATHKALGRVDRTLRVCHRLASSQLAYQPLPAPLVERHHRRRRPLSLRAGNYDRVAALQDCNAAVGRSEVYPDAFAHLPLLSWGFVSPSVPSLFASSKVAFSGPWLSGCSAELIPRPLLLPLPRAFLLRTPCAWCPLPVPSL